MDGGKWIYQQFTIFEWNDYPNISLMPINDGFLKEIRHLIPNKDWKVSRSGIWQYFSPKNSDIPLQGWKIHISATYNNRVKIAQKAIEVLVKNSIHFKVLADNRRFIYDYW